MTMFREIGKAIYFVENVYVIWKVYSVQIAHSHKVYNFVFPFEHLSKQNLYYPGLFCANKPLALWTPIARK